MTPAARTPSLAPSLALLLAAALFTPIARADDPSPAAKEVAAAYADLETAVRSADRSQFDSQAVLEKVGRDASDLAKWVSDHTTLLPYRGVLRGPAGVLQDGGGNSLDRALLLADLLQSAGCETRLVNAQLTPAQVQTLRSGLKPLAAIADVDAVPAQTAAARQTSTQQADQLLALLAKAGVNPASPDLSQALIDHWWVQRKDDTDKWVDVDPDNLTGLTPSRTVAYANGQWALDAKDFQEVDFTVLIEVYKNGQLKTEPVLTHTFRPVDLVGKTITFTHTAGQLLKAADITDTPDAHKKLLTAMAKQEAFLPVLRIDQRIITKSSFSTDGKVAEGLSVDKTGKLGAGNDNIGEGFDALTGATPTRGVLTAEWVEYAVRVPGEAPQVVRRPVFDAIGPAARAAGVKETPKLTDAQTLDRALCLFGQTQLSLQTCRNSADFTIYRFGRDLLSEKDLWMGIAVGGYKTPEQRGEAIDRVALRDTTTPGAASLRAIVAGSASGATFVDRPNVIAHTNRLLVEKDGTLAVWRGMDLAFTSTAAVGDNAFRRRLTQGVADTWAERMALGAGADPKENTAGVFAATNAAPIVLKPGDAIDAKLPADTAARVADDLKAGNVVVLASADLNRWGWWRVNPTTGQTVGVMDTGYNAAAEKAEQEAEVASKVSNFVGRTKPSDLAKMRGYDQFLPAAKGNIAVAKGIEQASLKAAVTIGRLGAIGGF